MSDFWGTADGSVLRGRQSIPGRELPQGFIIAWWMNYAWSAFYVQWVAIAWCALIGKESP